MNPRVLLTTLCACLVAACASRPPAPTQPAAPTTLPYVAPVSGALASLLIRSNQVAGLGIVSSFEEQRTCKGTRVIANTRSTENQLKASTSLRADEPASLWFAYVAPGNRVCNIALTFKPGKDKKYLAQANVTELGCGMLIQDISDPLNPRLEPTRFQRTYVASSREGAHCVAVDVDAQMAKARKPNLSGLKMEDLKALLPTPTESAK